MLDGKDVATCCAWFAQRPDGWCERVVWASLDLSNSYRTVFDTMLPDLAEIDADRDAVGSEVYWPLREGVLLHQRSATRVG